jgi:hypothetical protein
LNAALGDSKLIWEHLDDKNLRVLQAVIRRVLKMPREHIPESDEAVLSNDFMAKELRTKEALRSVLLPYVGAELTPQLATQISRHVAGWSKELKDGVPFVAWDPAEGPTWGLMYVISVERLIKERYYYKCVIESRAGASVNMQWRTTYSGPYLKKLLRDIGGSRYTKYLAEDFAGMWFTGFQDYRKGHLAFRDTWINHSQLAANRALLKLRQGFCYKGVFNTRCYNCHLGKDQCPASRHVETYPEDLCRNGHKGYIVKGGYCLACISAGRFEIERRQNEQTPSRSS